MRLSSAAIGVFAWRAPVAARERPGRLIDHVAIEPRCRAGPSQDLEIYAGRQRVEKKFRSFDLGLASSSGFSCSGAAMSEPSPPIFVQLVRPGLCTEDTRADDGVRGGLDIGAA